MTKKVIYLPTCQSTSTSLLEMSQQISNLPAWTTLYTSEQTAGRGQRGNSWESMPQQNLTFSYLLYPNTLPLSKMFALSMVTALGIYDFLKNYIQDHSINIKYPNDILVGKQKIAGILIENTLKGEAIDKSIIGIGLNINQTQFQTERATSLALATSNNTYDLQTCLVSLLDCLEMRYSLLKEEKYSEIKANFLAKSFQFNELCTYYTLQGEIYGKIIDIDFAGMLYIQTQTDTKTFHFKEISFFPKFTF